MKILSGQIHDTFFHFINIIINIKKNSEVSQWTNLLFAVAGDLRAKLP
jgi:hypothetical protein